MARTVEFDRNEVLESAMLIFWKNGYSMTSIPNLVSATKLNPGSIYSAFQSKEGLFLETLSFYGQRSVAQLKQVISESETPLKGIEKFLTAIANQTKSKDMRGCLIVNTLLEMSSHSEQVQTQAKRQLQAVEDELLVALKQAQTMSELPAEKDLVALTKFLMVNVWGLRVLAKTNDDSNSADLALEQILLSLKS